MKKIIKILCIFLYLIICFVSINIVSVFAEEEVEYTNVLDDLRKHCVRKFKQIDGQVQPYIYLGKGNTIEAEGNKPITIKLELEQEVPNALYREFNHKV
jgi:hypothetical protein